MTKKLMMVCGLMLVAAIGALAADISGKWVAQVPGREGQTRESVITLKQDGEKLTGTMSGGQGGDQAITDGKVTGDTVTFSVESQRGKRTYTGKVSGNEIKFKREGGQTPQEFTAKRSTT